MLIGPNERAPIARLLLFLERGEQLAHDCAAAQARLVKDPGMRRFLLGQARQEAVHAVAFQGAIAWLAPRHVGSSPLLPSLERYRALIDDALGREDLYETILAEQIILEGLGQAILNRMEVGLAKRNAGFSRLRRVLLHQEEAHHAFGQRLLDRAITAGEISPDTLRARAHEYLTLSETMVTTLGNLFDSIHEDPTAYLVDAKSALPSWL